MGKATHPTLKQVEHWCKLSVSGIHMRLIPHRRSRLTLSHASGWILSGCFLTSWFKNLKLRHLCFPYPRPCVTCVTHASHLIADILCGEFGHKKALNTLALSHLLFIYLLPLEQQTKAFSAFAILVLLQKDFLLLLTDPAFLLSSKNYYTLILLPCWSF